MGHHIDEQGRFQSDKYPELGPDKVVISLKDPRATLGLKRIAKDYAETDREFADDLLKRVLELGRAQIDWGRVQALLRKQGHTEPLDEAEKACLTYAHVVDTDRFLAAVTAQRDS